MTHTCTGKCEGTLVADSLEVFAQMDALNTRVHQLATTKIKNGSRVGQAYFLALHAYAPELADIIRGTDEDPFYDDENLDSFFKAIWGNAQSVVWPNAHTI